MFGLDIKTSKETARHLKMVLQLKERLQTLQRVVPAVVAAETHRLVKDGIPADREYKAYKNGLEVAKVVGLPKKYAAYSIFLKHPYPLTSRLKANEVPSTLIFVRPTKRLFRKSDVVQILERYNPWTLATLPVTPSLKEARLEAKKASRQVVARVEKRIRHEQPQWSAALQRAKVPASSKRISVKEPAKPDYSATSAVLSLEQGIGRRGRPHWRPALAVFTRDPARAILRAYPDIRKLLDPSFRSWKRFGPPIRSSISLVAASRFTTFQAKLGYRGDK